MFTESTRNSSRRRSSPSVKEREKDRLSEKTPGPSIVLRPALPNVPGNGSVKAAGLKNPLPESSGRPVASALPAPTAPVPPAFAWLPRTLAVNGRPVCAVNPPLRVQSDSNRPFQPLDGIGEFFPTGEATMKLLVSACLRSKLDRPRSALRSLAFCATVAPPPPIEEASSIDFP